MYHTNLLTGIRKRDDVKFRRIDAIESIHLVIENITLLQMRKQQFILKILVTLHIKTYTHLLQ